MLSKQHIYSVVFFIIYLFITFSLQAQTTYTWSFPGKGDWDTAAHWTPNGIPGAGDTVIIPADTVELNSNKNVSVFILTGIAIIGGTGTLTIDDSLFWGGGDMMDGGTTVVAAGASALVDHSSNIDLTGRIFENYGSLVWTGSKTWKIKEEAIIYNRPGAVFDIQRDGTLDYVADSDGGSFYNEGTLKKTAGTGDRMEIDPLFTNASGGIVQCSSGILRFERGSTTVSTGSFIVDVGDTIQISERTFMLDGATFSGGGVFAIVNRPNMQVNGSGLTVASGTTLQMNTDDSGGKGFLEGDGDLTINGIFEWTEGIVRGSGDFIINGDLVTSFGSTRYLDGKTLINHGDVVLTEPIRLANDAIIDNRSSGVIEIQKPIQILDESSGGSSILNAGNLLRNTTNGQAVIEVPLVNSGTLNIQQGRLNVDNDLTNQSDGVIMGVDTLDVLGQTFSNSGILRPGTSPGIFTILGNVTQQPGSEIDIEVGGLTPGSNFDRIDISGSLALGGILNLSLINGFEPAATDSFTVMNYSSHSGQFFAINNAALNGSGVFKVNEGADSLRLSVTMTTLFTLDVDTVGNGGIALAPSGAQYDSATSVVLTATADTGHYFTGWSGDLSGAASPDTVQMDSNIQITGTFLPLPNFTLTAATSGSGAVTLNPPGGVYDSTTVVTLTATPNAGHYFSGWSGDLGGSATPDSILMDGNKNVTANFAPLPQFTLDIDTIGGGGVVVTPDTSGGIYDSMSVISLSAAPDSGYYFAGWSGDLSGNDNPANVTMNSNKNITANFVLLPDFVLAIQKSGSGSVAMSPDTLPGGVYDSTTVVTLTATADSGYFFSGWSGDLSGSDNPETILMDENKTVTAIFIPRFLLDVDTIGVGSVAVTPDSSGRIYDSLDVVKLSAAPGAGYYFSGWSGDVSSSDNPLFVTMNADKNIDAVFLELPDFVLDVDTVGDGGVTLSPAGGVYDSTTIVALTATANAGYAFNGWSGALSGLANPTTITMDGPKNVTATFVPLSSLFNLDVDTVGNGGISLNPGGGAYDSLVVVTLTATPDAGYYFTGWSGDLGGNANPDSITMNSHKNVTGNFAELPDFTLTANTSGNGSVSLDPSGGTYDSTTVVNLTATADPGYQFSHWSGDLSGSSRFQSLLMDENKTVTAHFILQGTYYVWNTGSGGSWTSSSSWSPNGVPSANDTAVVRNQAVTVSSNRSVAMLVMDDGVLDGSGTLTITDSLYWESGDMEGTGTTILAAGAGGLISHGGSTIDLNVRTFENYGNIVWEGTGVWKFKNQCVFYNREGGIFDVRRDGTLDYVADLNGGYFHNEGTLKKSSGTGRIEIDPLFANYPTGVVHSQSGILRFERGNTSIASSGYFNADSGHYVQISERIFMMDSAFVGGSGTMDIVDRATFQMTGDGLTVDSGATLQMNTDAQGSSGYLEGSGPLIINGTFDWSQGTVRGSGDWIINGTLQSSSGGTRVLDTRTITNNGHFIMNNALRVTNNAQIDNQSGGVFDFQNTVTLEFLSPNGGTIANAGTIQRSTTYGAANIDLDVTNSGIVKVVQGELKFTEDFDNQSGGSLQGVDTLNLISANATHAGSISPGTSPGTLRLRGDFSPSSSASVDIELGGTTAGTEHDQLIITGTANLGGTLNVSLINGFMPVNGQTFTILTSGSRNGQFSTLNLPTLNGGPIFEVLYSGDDVILNTLILPGYEVTLDTVGNGGISLDPPGGTYTLFSDVEFTATPDSGHRFLGWSGDLSGTQNPDTLEIDTTKHVIGTFVRQFALAANTISGGSILFNPDSSGGAVYDTATMVTLTAVPDSGYIFLGWSGDLSGNSAIDSLTMNSDKQITATFLPQYALAAQTIGAGSIQIFPETSSGIYDSASVVSFTAIPDSGHVFVSWSGDLSGAASPDSLVMNNDKQVIATFIPQYFLGIDTTGSGGIAVAPDTSGRLYDSASVVTLTATPDSAFTFAGWSGDLGGAANPAMVTMDSNLQITGNFIPTYQLSLSATSGGSVAKLPNNPGGIYDSASVVNLLATPDSGFGFTGWSGDLSGTSLTDSIVMNSNKTITANFDSLTSLQFVVDVDTIGAGGITFSPPGGLYNGGTMVAISAAADSAWRFAGWSGDLDGDANPDSFTVNANKNITGTFLRQFQLLTNAASGGSITPNPTAANGIYDSLTQIHLTATPDSAYRFTGWGGDLNGDGNPDSLIMDDDKSVSAGFVRLFQLTTSVIGGGNIQIFPDTSGGIYDSNTVVAFTAIPDSGYSFAGWSADLSGVSVTDSIAMTADRAVIATFIRQFALAVDTVGSGSITPNPAGSLFDSASVVTFTAAADSGWRFSGWSGDLSGSANPDSLVMNSDKSVTGTFIRQFTLDIDTIGPGSVSLSPAPVGGVYDSGTVVTLTATANSNSLFGSWSGDLSGITNPEVITMDGDKQVSATFTEVSAIVFEEVETGTSTGSSVSTSANLTAANNHLYLAAISTRNHKAVSSVSGLGLTWTLVAEQCGGRMQTGVEVWMALGAPTGDGVVTATFSSIPANSVITVSRYSGVNTTSPIGTTEKANTNGSNGACSGGADSNSYSLNLPTTSGTSIIFSAAALRNKSHTSGTGFTERAEENSGGASGNAAGVAVQDQASTGFGSTMTVDGTFSGSVDWAVIALEIMPVNTTSNVVVNTKIFLEGAYRDNTMDTTLAENSLLPTQQPFNTAPWNYAGEDSTAIMPGNIVDWVMIKLRSTATDSAFATRAALLRFDGQVVDMDGSSPVIFDGVGEGSYYIVICQRNHLAVMSSDSVALTDSSALYDFTTASSQAYGSGGIMDLGGVFGMIAGDGNSDGGIDATDKNNVWRIENGTIWQYGKYSDFNLDGGVDANDVNLFWQNNNGKSTQVPSGSGVAKSRGTRGNEK